MPLRHFPQLARVTGRSEKKLYPRLQGLRAHRLVDFRRPLITRGVYLATRAGLEVAGLELPPATLDIRTFAHDPGVAGLAAELAMRSQFQAWLPEPTDPRRGAP